MKIVIEVKNCVDRLRVNELTREILYLKDNEYCNIIKGVKMIQ